MIRCEILIAYVEADHTLMIDVKPDLTLASDVERALGKVYDIALDEVRDYVFGQCKAGAEIKGEEVARRVGDKMRSVMLADQLKKLGFKL